MRSVDSNVLIAGNLAFRQGATLAGDWGIEAGRAWLRANPPSLASDQPAVTDGGAYWANWQANLDLIGSQPTVPDFDWNTAKNLGTDSGGNEVRYVIHRLCAAAGDPNSPGANCVKASAGSGSGPSAGGTKGTASYSSQALPGTSATFYRVTVRVVGPRNTRSYVQAVLN
jgi:hypothetical protein